MFPPDVSWVNVLSGAPLLGVADDVSLADSFGSSVYLLKFLISSVSHDFVIFLFCPTITNSLLSSRVAPCTSVAEVFHGR